MTEATTGQASKEATKELAPRLGDQPLSVERIAELDSEIRRMFYYSIRRSDPNGWITRMYGDEDEVIHEILVRMFESPPPPNLPAMVAIRYATKWWVGVESRRQFTPQERFNRAMMRIDYFEDSEHDSVPTVSCTPPHRRYPSGQLFPDTYAALQTADRLMRSVLDDRVVDIIWQSAEGISITVIGQQYGVTRQRISKIRQDARRKLEKAGVLDQIVELLR